MTFFDSLKHVNKIFVLSIKNKVGSIIHTGYQLPTVEIKNYNVMVDERNFLTNLFLNDIRT